MRRILLSFLLAQAWLLSFAQAPRAEGQVAARIDALLARGVAFPAVQLVLNGPSDAHTSALWQQECTRAEVVRMNTSVISRM